MPRIPPYISSIAAATLKCECSDCGDGTSVAADGASSSCETSGACYIRVSNQRVNLMVGPIEALLYDCEFLERLDLGVHRHGLDGAI